MFHPAHTHAHAHAHAHVHDRVRLWLATLDTHSHSDCPAGVGSKRPRGDDGDDGRPVIYMAPATPPTSHAGSFPQQPLAVSREESPAKRQRIDASAEIDHDQTPRILQTRPILHPTCTTPSHFRPPRSPSPTRIQSLADLSILEKPVTNSTKVQGLSPDVKDLYQRTRRVLHYNGFVPGEIQEDFAALLPEEDGYLPEDWWFLAAPTATSSDRRKLTLLKELDHVADIHRRAVESFELRRHEAAWTSAVHHPMLELAFDSRDPAGVYDATGLRIRIENITAATVTGDCLPRLDPGHDNDSASVGAWSVSQVSSSSSRASNLIDGDTGNVFTTTPQRPPRLDGTVHTKSNAKKVDFALVLVPEPETSLYAAIRGVRRRLHQTPHLSQSINPFHYMPLVEAPIAVTVEMKTAISARDPLVQLGLTAAAMHRRLHTLPVRHATGCSPVTETGMLMTLPQLTVTDHRWEIYFAYDRGDQIELIGPFEMGSTATLVQSYMLLANLRHLKAWIREHFRPALEAWLTLPD